MANEYGLDCDAGHRAWLDTPLGSAAAMTRPHHTTGWPIAASATLHCLTGCAIGEVLGMVIGTAAAQAADGHAAGGHH